MTHPRGYRSSRAAAGAARSVTEIPRITCRSGVKERELGSGRFAQHDRACAFEAQDSLSIVVWDKTSERLGTGLSFRAGGIEDVLDTDRYAMERATQIPLTRFAVKLGSGI